MKLKKKKKMKLEKKKKKIKVLKKININKKIDLARGYLTHFKIKRGIIIPLFFLNHYFVFKTSFTIFNLLSSSFLSLINSSFKSLEF